MEGALRGQHARSHLLTIHLQDVGLEQLLVAQGVAGVVSHVDCGHLGDVQRVILTEVLWDKKNDGEILFSPQQTAQLVS